MSGGDEVRSEIERLKQLAASVRMDFRPAVASADDIQRFEGEAGFPIGEDLCAFWLAADDQLPLVAAALAPTVMWSHSFATSREAWLPSGREETIRSGGLAGTVTRAASEGTQGMRLLIIASDTSGDSLQYAVADGPAARAGQVVAYDHELDHYTSVAPGLADLLRESNRFIEANVDLVFFSGDLVAKILHGEDTDELKRQLDAGLSPNYGAGRPSGSSLVGEAIERRRDDIFHVLLERGLDLRVALIEAWDRRRLDLVELLLKRGADPAARLDDGRTLLASGAASGKPRGVALLVSHGAKRKIPASEWDAIVTGVRNTSKLSDGKRDQVLSALGAAGLPPAT